MISAIAICKNLRPPDLHARDPWFPGRRPIEDQRQQPSTHVILVISRIKRLKEVQKMTGSGGPVRSNPVNREIRRGVLGCKKSAVAAGTLRLECAFEIRTKIGKRAKRCEQFRILLLTIRKN